MNTSEKSILPGTRLHGVYALKLIPVKECARVMSRLKGVEADAPNSMNKYGGVLEKPEHTVVADELFHSAIIPFARFFFPRAVLTSVYAFIVRYENGKQRSLAKHRDDSKVTMNICIDGDFEGGGLSFYDAKGKKEHTFPQYVGQSFLHLGSHVHRAEPITRGTRTNLVLWCR